MFEHVLFVGLIYKSTCASFVLNPKAPKSLPSIWIAFTKNGFSAQKSTKSHVAT